MKKKGFVAAAMAAVLASSMLSVPAFAWSKDDIIAGDEHTLIVSYHWSGIDQLVIGDTEDELILLLMAMQDALHCDGR